MKNIHIHNYCSTLNLGQSLKHVGGVHHGAGCFSFSYIDPMNIKIQQG
jgi:hypothetical protein